METLLTNLIVCAMFAWIIYEIRANRSIAVEDLTNEVRHAGANPRAALMDHLLGQELTQDEADYLADFHEMTLTERHHLQSRVRKDGGAQ